MATPKSKGAGLLGAKPLIFLYLALILLLNDASCVRINRPAHETPVSSSPVDTQDSQEAGDLTGPRDLVTEDDEDNSLLERERLTPRRQDPEDYDEDDDIDDDEEDEDDYLDRTVDSSLLEVGHRMDDRTNQGLDSGIPGRSNSKSPNDNMLRNYLEKLGALDKARSAKEHGKHAIKAVKSKISALPEQYRKIKGKVYGQRGATATGPKYTEPHQDHRKRLLNTMNEVDGRRNTRPSRLSAIRRRFSRDREYEG